MVSPYSSSSSSSIFPFAFRIMGGTQSLEDQIFDLRFGARQVKQQSTKCSKQETKEKEEAAKAIREGHMDVARIHAENAIRSRTEVCLFAVFRTCVLCVFSLGVFPCVSF